MSRELSTDLCRGRRGGRRRGDGRREARRRRVRVGRRQQVLPAVLAYHGLDGLRLRHLLVSGARARASTAEAPVQNVAVTGREEMRHLRAEQRRGFGRGAVVRR